MVLISLQHEGLILAITIKYQILIVINMLIYNKKMMDQVDKIEEL